MSNREKFEAWYLENWGHTEDNHESLFERCQDGCGDEYYRFGVRMAYEAWQAASKASEQQLAAVVAECAGLEKRTQQLIDIISNADNDYCMCGDAMKNHAHGGCGWPTGMFDYHYNKWLESGNETPATDAYLAEVRAQARNEGINYAASRLAAAFNHGFVDKPLAEVYDVVRMILTAKEDLANDPAADGLSGEYAEKSLVEFAAQLRQGAAL